MVSGYVIFLLVLGDARRIMSILRNACDNFSIFAFKIFMYLLTKVFNCCKIKKENIGEKEIQNVQMR